MPDHVTAGIIVIGDEILKGITADTNSHEMAKILFSKGIVLKEIRTISDHLPTIAKTVRHFSNTYNYVFTSGGIGPTHDDLTFEGVAQAFDDRLELNAELEGVVRRFFAERFLGCPLMDEPYLRLAMIPSTSNLLWKTSISSNTSSSNAKLKYPIVQVRNVIVLPGVPVLMKKAIDYAILNLDIPQGALVSRSIVSLYSKVDEFTFAPILKEIVASNSDVNIGSYPDFKNNYYRVRLTIDHESSERVNEVIEECRKKLPTFLIDCDAEPLVNCTDKFERYLVHLSEQDDEENREYIKWIKYACSLIDEMLEKYDPDQICMSFNGGKDCTALLYLLHVRRMKNQLHCDVPINCLYVRPDDPFDELEEFVDETSQRYNINLLRFNGRIKPALERLVAEQPRMYIMFMGGRRTDPGHANIQSVSPTDEGWPALLRVNPILDFDYAHVWKLVRDLYLPYCALYDQGYTSVGCRRTTKPNPLLSYKDNFNNTLYHPAYTLNDAEHERAGRQAAF